MASVECVLSGTSDTWSVAQLNWPVDCPVSISYASSGAHKTNSTKPFAHSVSSGFQWSDRSMVFRFLQGLPATHVVDNILFQIPWEADLQATIEEIASEFANLPWNCNIYLRLANSNPATSNFDDAKIAQRIRTALQLATGNEKLQLSVDTFMDIDRGYSPRHGLIDRLCNLRDIGRDIGNEFALVKDDPV